jgi:hypothetical protein
MALLMVSAAPVHSSMGNLSMESPSRPKTELRFAENRVIHPPARLGKKFPAAGSYADLSELEGQQKSAPLRRVRCRFDSLGWLRTFDVIAGEPHVRQLEPDWWLAPAAR